ncbi:hypothetical protein [Flavihumibacter solisilvae]|jgi:hypothetical protein|uniref:Phosphatidate cytidylyltransferase n=1 Tax=Flavihumibacter solisilvae TaxID=1349421 RepID=A0A0C1IL77_9BACT|nr:hypothetical protein [Flavihumibacter solisilvae]KIC94915.1 phosphatidate cytidylyltransferase [Flavihumibacter solisilvae]
MGNNSVILFLVFFLVTFSGCSVIGDIFEAGVWVGVLAVIGIIALIIWLVGRGSK